MVIWKDGEKLSLKLLLIRRSLAFFVYLTLLNMFEKTFSLMVLMIASLGSIKSQQLLSEKYEAIRDESKKYNEEIAAVYFKENPVELIVSRDRSTLDHAKFFMFYEGIWVLGWFF